jgi:hypothetical protein
MASSAFDRLDQPEEDDFSGLDAERDESGGGRTSEDVRRHDHETLNAEEEAERLLGGEKEGESRLKALFKRDGESRSERKKSRRKRRREGRGEKRELMYEMEEGGPRSSSAESSEVDMQRLGEMQAKRKVDEDGRACYRSTLI